MLKILFFGEAVTLAHIGRPLTLAASLDPREFEIHFACAEKATPFLKEKAFHFHPIQSLSGDAFMNALRQAVFPYSEEVIEQYVREDLELIQKIRPDLIVGDFRLSLQISARLAMIPLYTILNSYWSPYAEKLYPASDIPLTRALGPRLTELLMPLGAPRAFRLQARTLNRVRARHGLAPHRDLREVYADGDFVLYPEVPTLVPLTNPPTNHVHLGPVHWSPEIETPHWWNELPADRPMIYLTFGSSGAVDLLPLLVKTLGELPVTVMLSTAGRADLRELPSNILAAPLLPGDEASRRSSLVICGGSSATAYQALAHGVPVIGIPSNMDQHLAMIHIERARAGLRLRSEDLDQARLREAVQIALNSENLSAGARAMRDRFDAYPAQELFPRLLRSHFS